MPKKLPVSEQKRTTKRHATRAASRAAALPATVISTDHGKNDAKEPSSLSDDSVPKYDLRLDFATMTEEEIKEQMDKDQLENLNKFEKLRKKHQKQEEEMKRNDAKVKGKGKSFFEIFIIHSKHQIQLY